MTIADASLDTGTQPAAVSAGRPRSLWRRAKPVVTDMTVQKLGANRAAVDQALGANNVEYVWKLDDKVLGQARTYAQQMLELKQIRQLPKFDTFLNPKFSNEIAAA